jgi:hypothetical protein
MEPALPPEPDAGPRVVDLRARPGAGDESLALLARLATAETDRDRLAVELRDAQVALQDARVGLAERVADLAASVEEAGRLRAELAAAAARAAALGERDGVLGRLARELAGAAQAARVDVEVHLAARAPEARLAAAHGELAVERARAARAETTLRLQRAAVAPPAPSDPAVLVAARERLQTATVALAAPAGLVDDLARAAERLRLAAPEAPPAPLAPGARRRARQVLRRLFG